MGEKRLMELKVRLPGLTEAASWCAKHAAPIDDVKQTDTYFRVKKGRLKLRVVEGRQEGTLIYYRREDRAGPKRSLVSLLAVPNPASLLSVLGEALGTLIEIRKRRQIFRWEKVQIHLDQVEGLGPFLEFERIIESTEDAEESKAEFGQLSEALALQEEDLVVGSYSDLALEERAGGQRA